MSGKFANCDVGAHADGRLGRRLVEASAGHAHVALRNRVVHVEHGDVHREQLAGIGLDVELARIVARDLHVSDALDALERGLDLVHDDVRELGGLEASGRDRLDEDRLRAHVHFLDHRRVEVGRQRRARRVHRLRHVVGGGADVRAELELRHDRRRAVDRGRVDFVEVADRLDLVLDRPHDEPLDLGGARARIAGRHRHDREVDVGDDVLPHRQVADRAEQRDGEEEQRDDRGLPDGKARQPHAFIYGREPGRFLELG